MTPTSHGHHEGWKQPDWMYLDRKPKNDNAYFEVMARSIFVAGLNWDMVDKKWPGIKNAFDGFSVNKVAEFGEKKIKELLQDPGIIRNRAKVEAIVHNAKRFQAIHQEHGSFAAYLEWLKGKKKIDMPDELALDFKRLGKGTARVFLYSVGEGWHA
jgi:DNA-3-methyladenine glycosylase I